MPEGNSELWNALQRGSKGPVYRRRKRHQGADWTPEKESAAKGDGFWCPACRIRHGAMQKKALRVEFEQRNGVWYTLWICTKTDNVLAETSAIHKHKPQKYD